MWFTGTKKLTWRCYYHFPLCICLWLGPEYINRTLCITAEPPTNPCFTYLEVHLCQEPTKQSQTGVKRPHATYCSGFRNARCLLGQILPAVCVMKHQHYGFFLWFQLFSRLACNLFRRVTSKPLPISYTSMCMSLTDILLRKGF